MSIRSMACSLLASVRAGAAATRSGGGDSSVETAGPTELSDLLQKRVEAEMIRPRENATEGHHGRAGDGGLEVNRWHCEVGQ